MDEEQFDDLKQFIEATVSQSELRLKGELASKDDLLKLEGKVDSLEAKMDAGFAGVGEAIETLGDHIEARLDDHETRLSTLEQAA